MKKKIVFTIAIIAALTTALFILSFPSPPEPEITPNPSNTELYAALASVGIEDAVVDVTEERALIRYNLPENMSKEAARYYIMGAAATVAPNSSKIIIQVYENFEPLEEVIVDAKDVLAFMNGSITFDEFKERIIVKSLK